MPIRYLFPLALVAAGCASPGIPGPTAPERGLVAVRVRSSPNFSVGRIPATRVHFIRLEKGDDVAAVTPTIASNLVRGDVVYLLDAAPGNYAVVAAERTDRGKTEIVYFPAGLVRRTITKVRPGRAAFIGSIELDVSQLTKQMDAAQTHYWKTIDPKTFHAPALRRALARTQAARPRRWSFAPRGAALLRDRARGHFEETAWREMIR